MKKSRQQKSLGVPDFFAFSYEGGDSEFINYLKYYHKVKMCPKCVLFVIKI